MCSRHFAGLGISLRALFPYLFLICYNKDVMFRKITSFLLYFIVFSLLGGVFFLPGFAVSGDDKDSYIPNDEFYKYQWYLNKVKADKAWEYVSESPEVTIAVIDSGVQIDHPDLKDNIWVNQGEVAGNQRDDDNNGFIDDVHGWDFVDDNPDPSPKMNSELTQDGVSHGTIVAGIAAAVGNNEIGVTGITWNASIMPLRVLDEQGQGRASDVIRAIDYAIDNGADIINLSFVGMERSNSMLEALKRAHEAGVIVVAAAGNDRGDGEGYNLNEAPMYPVCYNQENSENIVLGVGATDPLDQKANFSSYGACVDIMAPGYSVFGTVAHEPSIQNNSGVYLDKKYDGFWSGTSMAAPMISGSLALIMAANPDLDNHQVKQVLLSSADNIDRLNPSLFGELGAGRLNVESSVKKALDFRDERTSKVLLSPQSYEPSHIKISDYNKDVVRTIEAFPFRFEGGINSVSGDVNGNGKMEVIATPGAGGGPQVRIFSLSGELLSQFFAYDQDFRGGVNVATGDINGDGKKEIITGAGPGGGPHVRIFDQNGELLGQFFAYDQDFRGGVNVLGINVCGKREGTEEIVTAPQKDHSPEIRIFNKEFLLIEKFLAYGKGFKGGVNIAGGDLNRNGVEEIVTGAGIGGGPHVRYFDIQGNIVNSFYAYEKDLDKGVNVGVINTN